MKFEFIYEGLKVVFDNCDKFQEAAKDFKHPEKIMVKIYDKGLLIDELLLIDIFNL